MSNVIAVNVCLILPFELEERFVALSRDLCIPRSAPITKSKEGEGGEPPPPLFSEQFGYQLGSRRQQAECKYMEPIPLPHVTLTQLFIREDQIPLLQDGVQAALDAATMEWQHQTTQEAGDGDSTPSSAYVEILRSAPSCGPCFANDDRLGGILLPSGVMDHNREHRAQQEEGGAAPNCLVDVLHCHMMKASKPFRLETKIEANGEETRGKNEAPSMVLPFASEEERQAALSKTYVPLWGGNKGSVDWVINFETRAAGPDKYHPHVTLGALRKDDVPKLQAKYQAHFAPSEGGSEEKGGGGGTIRLGVSESVQRGHNNVTQGAEGKCQVVVAQMGNYCSCVSIL